MIGGDMTLGCLLGQYDGAQSFDVASKGGSLATGDVGSWNIIAAVGSIEFTRTIVHSSGQGLVLHVGCLGAAFPMLQYDYQKADDAFARWSPDVTTHGFRADFWALINNDGERWFMDWNLGAIQISSFGVTPPIVIQKAKSLSAFSVVSGDGSQFRIAATATSATAQIQFDDVLVTVDPITLHPTFETEHRQQLISEQQRTLGGRLYSTVWDKFFAYTLPLQFLPTSHADLINWWWENNFNLALTLDTSDSESIRICRIANTQQPIGRRMSPYFDQWQGALLLESIDRGSLVF